MKKPTTSAGSLDGAPGTIRTSDPMIRRHPGAAATEAKRRQSAPDSAFPLSHFGQKAADAPEPRREGDSMPTVSGGWWAGS